MPGPQPAQPKVYASISAVTNALAKAGIAKGHINQDDGYAFRGIDDVMKAVAPLLARNKLCILPVALARSEREQQENEGQPGVFVSLRMGFDIVSAKDGSSHRIEMFGEALDLSDKATSKAASAAYKQAILQAFCIPAVGYDESDRVSPKLAPSAQIADPIQGWDEWGSKFVEKIDACQSLAEIDVLRQSQSCLLRASSNRSVQVYQSICTALRDRQGALGSNKPL